MEDDEQTETPDVVIDLPDPETPPDVEVNVEPVIVMEEPETEPEVPVEIAVDQASRLGGLEVAVAGLIDEMRELRDAVTQTEAVTEAVVDEVVETAAEVEEMGEVVTETAADTVDDAPDLDGDGEPDVPPETARQHWMFRPAREWRRK